MEEAVRTLKEKNSVRRLDEAFNVSFSCLQRRFQGNQMNKCSKERGGQTVFSSDLEQQLVDSSI
jgi:hypothetical protein